VHCDSAMCWEDQQRSLLFNNALKLLVSDQQHFKASLKSSYHGVEQPSEDEWKKEWEEGDVFPLVD
jgi:hypothetical protein